MKTLNQDEQIENKELLEVISEEEEIQSIIENQEKDKKTLEDLSKEIENYNFKIIEKTFGEEASKQLKEKNSFSYNFTIENEAHRKQVLEDRSEKQGYSEAILLTLPFLWTDQTEKQLQDYKKKLQETLKIRDERTKIVEDFYNIRARIEENSQRLAYYKSETHKKHREKFKKLEQSIISSQTLYDIGKKCQNEYFATIRENEKKELVFEVERSFDIVSMDFLNDDNIVEKLGLAPKENQLSKYNFKDIASKTQSVSMYKRQRAIFLDGEKMKELFDQFGTVSIPFGLMESNQKEIEYKFTKLNHTLSTTSQKIFNACCSAQWIMKENQYPINETIIEEDTLYQLWKGDKTFSNKPSSDQIKQLKEEILGMSTNISKMNFSREYNYLDEKVRAKYTEEGSFLPVYYRQYEIKKENGQTYKKNCYVFTKIAPLFDFFINLNMVNTAPLEIESVLKSSTMNDFISETIKEEIASLYYFKNTGSGKGTQEKEYITSGDESLSKYQWREKTIKEGKLQGFWRYSSTRKIESLFQEWLEIYKRNEKVKRKMKDDEELILSKDYIRKTRLNFIDSLVTFLREAREIDWKEKKWLESFVLYDPKGEEIEDSDFITEKEKSIYKKQQKKQIKTPKNASIDKIKISIS